MDAALTLSHLVFMLTADQIREEMILQLEDGRIQGVDVARALNIAAARVTEMKGRTRRVQQHEMQPLAELLGMVEADPTKQDQILSVSDIPHWGRVAQGVWMEESALSPDVEMNSVPYDRFSGDGPIADLFAVTPEGTSMNLCFLPGSKLICRRVPSDFGTIRSGDYVIVQRTAHDLWELTCKRLEIDEDGISWLHSESSDAKFAEPWRIGAPDEDHHLDVEINIIGKVIRAVKVFDDA